MSFHRAAARGPLAQAMASLGTNAPPAPPAASGDLGGVLAELLDLRGSVRIAQAIAAKPRDTGLLADPNAVRRARALVEGRVAELDAFVHGFSRAALGGRSPALSADRMEELLGSVEAAAMATAAIAIRALFAPLLALAARYIGQVRAAMEELRSEIAPVLQDGGPRLSRLEQLDAVLGAASDERRERLFARLAAALEASVAQAALAAIALPGATDASALAPGGWAHDVVASSAGLVRAALDHERARIEALLRAANDGPPS